MRGSDKIVDFYCHKIGLVIEVDGDIHNLQKEEDARREKVLKELGLRIIRFRNDEVENNLAGVITRVHENILCRSTKSAESSSTATEPKGFAQEAKKAGESQEGTKKLPLVTKCWHPPRRRCRRRRRRRRRRLRLLK